MKQNTSKFGQTNAFAMQYGLFLGIWGILSIVTVVLSMKYTSLSFIGLIMMVGSPILSGYFTMRFRDSVMQPEFGFTFGRGFLFTFLMGLYASLWIALFSYVYMRWFDAGSVANLYEEALNHPDYREAFRQSGVRAEEIVKMYRSIPPAGYAGSFIYITLLTAPFISAIIALIARRSPKIM